ncbi:MAG: response regulator [Planctomycetes bacterium]|nr:response regulator [Planctomycetota bacterium]
MTSPKQVLVVDDDQDIVRGTDLRLRAAGYSTLCAHTGERGLSLAAREHPDAIVLDVRMPGMDGLTVLSRLREREDTRRIPVVMLSASLRDQQKGLDAGARVFLTKPYRGRTLVEAVEMAIADSNPARDRMHSGRSPAPALELEQISIAEGPQPTLSRSTGRGNSTLPPSPGTPGEGGSEGMRATG